MQKKVEVYGDSVLKGIQVNPKNMRYHIDNNIDIKAIAKKFFLDIRNFSKFGCTITKGLTLIKKRLQDTEPFCDAIIMNFGGNDCNFNWQAISERPEDKHLPNTPPDDFADIYNNIIDLLKEKGIRPILTTLPPLDAQKFFNWFCNGLDKMNVLKWLGGLDLIYCWQEHYSKTVEKIATETDTLLVDLRGAFLKHALVRHRRVEHLLCEDGTHPNTEGQMIITQAFLEFTERAKSRGEILI
jgi:lysophospholipase L1-like esterase